VFPHASRAILTYREGAPRGEKALASRKKMNAIYVNSEERALAMHTETPLQQVAPRTEPPPIQRMGQFDRSAPKGAHLQPIVRSISSHTLR
jgi:hypothetical protein